MTNATHSHKWTFDRLRQAIVNQESNPIDSTIIVVILLAAVTVGLETFPSIMTTYGGLLHALDIAFVFVFAAEVIVKLAFYMPKPLEYFKSGWHIFDVSILVLTTIPVIVQAGYGPIEAALALRSLSMIRSLRALRMLRLSSELRGIRIVIETLVSSLPQLGIVGLLLCSLIYTYAVVGFNLFHLNDPKHFGSLWQSTLTMFQCAVGDFSGVMHIQIDGSAFDSGYHESLVKHFPVVVSEPFPVLAPFFFLSFVFIAGLTILNFFVGTIISELDNVRQNVHKEEQKQNVSLEHIEQRLRDIEALLRDK